MTSALKFDGKLLKGKTPVTERSWKIWEKKTLNLHRGVIEWPDAPSDSVDAIAKRVRAGVVAEFNPSWFRGFGFGVVLHLSGVPSDVEEICQYVDRRNRAKGVWQWVILQFDREQTALGVHTWLHGYLRPVYESALQQLASDGYECHSVDAEIDPLIDALRKVAKYGKIGGIVEVLARFA